LRKTELVEALREAGIVINIRGLNRQQLLRGVAALAEGGIRAVELTHATIRNAGETMQKLKENGVLIGIGTITHSVQAREAGALGADFVTASVTTPDVVMASEQMSIPCILSSLTPTEVWRAHEMGADFVKVLSAGALGGPPYIRYLRESIPTLRLMGAEMPLDDRNYLSYLEAGIEVLEFKSSLAFPRLDEQAEWAETVRRAAKIVETRDCWRANHNTDV
jgi:2-dehydro-3-deoxyphosphogluconate aldolase/(4S)-4-hydroxy-2-oxoglutarate aldolase